MDINYYYKPSGKFNILSLIILLIFAIIGIIIFAFLYTLFNRFNPLIYIQIIGVFVRGFLISRFLNKLVYIFKIRSKILVYVLGVILVALSFFVHWSIYTSFAINTNGSDSFGSGSRQMGISYISTDFVKVISDILGVMLNPELILQNMKWIFDNGMRSIRGANINGRFIVAFWLAETAVVLFYSLYYLSDQVSRPFSELVGGWMQEKTSGKLIMPLDIKSDNDIYMLKSELEKGKYNFLKQLKKGSIDINEYCEIKIYTNAHDYENAHISVNSIYETTNKKGETEKDEKNIVKYLSIPNILANDLQKEYS